MSDGPSVASAFVPGHVTAFFSTHPDQDPLRAGSRGGGLALSAGVTVTVRGRGEEGPSVALNGEAIGIEAVERVLGALDVAERAAVTAETDLRLGAGFGVSGAMALGAALAANAVFGCGRTENELVALAHRAEVEAGTGLGDVVAQARGGVPLRLEPGAPEHGELDALPARSRVEYVSFGGLSTADVLAGDTNTLSSAGERALDRVRATPTMPAFMDAAREFARDAGLLTDRLETVVEDVDGTGGEASMAMLGETVFALGTGLSDAGYDPEICEIHPGGGLLVGTDDGGREH